MQVNVLGIDHSCAAAVREKAAFTETHMLEFSSIIMDLGAAEAVILSTCNRSEVYYLLPTAEPEQQQALNQRIRRAYLDYFQAGVNSELTRAVHYLSGASAVRHIFQVAAGLKSAIIGEDEILRQLKRAYEFAHRFHNTDKVFNRLFQEAIKCAKEIKSSLKISEIPLSPGYIGLKYLEECCGGADGLAGKNLLLIGFGEIGQLFFRYAREPQQRRAAGRLRRGCARALFALRAGQRGFAADGFGDYRHQLPPPDFAPGGYAAA